MAIVANIANAGAPIPNYSAAVDRKYESYNRSNAGSPNAALTPEFKGELVWDTTNKVLWKAVGLTNADWTPLGPEVT